VIAFSSVAVMLAVVVRRTEILPGERATTRWLNDHFDVPIVGAAFDAAFTDLAATAIFVMLVALVWWRWGRYPAAVLTFAGGITAVTKIGDIARRPRPTDDLEWSTFVVGQGGFPSGHVVYAVLVFGTITHLATVHARSRRARRAVTISSLATIALMGPSRISELDHWPADVIEGYLVGVSALVAVNWCAPRVPHLLEHRWPRAAQLLRTPGSTSTAHPHPST
jgi:membrane-associated phospholipid phosphatase